MTSSLTFFLSALYLCLYIYTHAHTHTHTNSCMRKGAFIQHSQVNTQLPCLHWNQKHFNPATQWQKSLSAMFWTPGEWADEGILLVLECIRATWILHGQCIWQWSQLVLWFNTAKTQHGPVYYRRNRVPFPYIRPDEWWVMKDEGEGKRQRERRQRREKGRRKREIKRTSVENDCLFGEGWLRSDKVKRALLRRVWSLKRGKIGRTGRRRGWNMWKERDTEGGKDRKRAKCRESGRFKKHLGAIREWREKRWTQLKLSAPLATLPAYSPASYPTNTFPQKTQSRRGRVQSIRELRESLSSASSYSPQATRSAVKVDHVLLTNGIRLRSTHCKMLAVNDIQTRNLPCQRFIWSCKMQHIKASPCDVCVRPRDVQAYTVLACISSVLSPALIDHLKNSVYDI